MSETSDFDRLAQQMADRLYDTVDGMTTKPGDQGPTFMINRGRYIDQLRLMWNARGAADRAKLETELSSQMGETAAWPHVKNLDRALRTLDR